jgi:hypothetical protein
MKQMIKLLPKALIRIIEVLAAAIRAPTPPSMHDDVKWKCPWCGRIATQVRQSICDCRQCDCGAIALGAPEGDWDEVTDAALGIFRVSTRPESRGFDALLREDILLAGVEMREGVRDPDMGHPWGWAYIYTWFRRGPGKEGGDSNSLELALLNDLSCSVGRAVPLGRIISTNFEAQNALERSLIQAAMDPACRPQFYRDLLVSDLILIPNGPPPEQYGPTALKAGDSLAISPIVWNGRQFIPVFSSVLRVQAVVQSEVPYIALNALELMKIAKDGELTLNTGAAYGKDFSRAEIESLLSGSIWEPTDHYGSEGGTSSTNRIGIQPPKTLVGALTRYFRKSKEVKRAYLAHFSDPDGDEKPHTLIVVEADEGWESIRAGADIVATGLRLADSPVYFLQLTGNGAVEDYFKECKPFYEKLNLGSPRP